MQPRTSDRAEARESQLRALAGRVAYLERKLRSLTVADAVADLIEGGPLVAFYLDIADAETSVAPVARLGRVFIFVDPADGDLKVRFGNNITKTLAVDT